MNIQFVSVYIATRLPFVLDMVVVIFQISVTAMMDIVTTTVTMQDNVMVRYFQMQVSATEMVDVLLMTIACVMLISMERVVNTLFATLQAVTILPCALDMATVVTLTIAIAMTDILEILVKMLESATTENLTKN